MKTMIIINVLERRGDNMHCTIGYWVCDMKWIYFATHISAKCYVLVLTQYL